MAKKNFDDFLPDDVRSKTGLNTFREAFYFSMSPSYRQKKSKKIGLTEVSPRVYEKQNTTPVTPRVVSIPSTVDVTAPKKKYASIGTSQMRSGRSSTIQTSSVGLLSQATIKKNTLLGG